MNLNELLELQLKSAKVKVEKRFEANQKLLQHLEKCINENPDLRFGQILIGFDFISQDSQKTFYEESVDILKRVENNPR